MIVKMDKVLVAVRVGQREQLLDRLRELGVIHLTPVDPGRAAADDKLLGEIGSCQRAGQILSAIEASGAEPQLTAMDTVQEVLQIERSNAERQNRLTTLHRQVEQQAMWGDVRGEQMEQLAQAGLKLSFFTVDRQLIGEVEADLVQSLGQWSKDRMLVGVVEKTTEAKLPEGTEPIEFPQKDNPTLRAEASEINAALKQDMVHLGELAQLQDEITALHLQLQEEAEYKVALHGGLAEKDLYAVQGWAPAERSATIGADLAQKGLEAAVQTLEAGEDESPPTLIRYPGWAGPIKGLFDILGTLPGYRELDLSGFFMLALPLFAAILIGDAGYGLVFLLPGVLFYKKLTAKAGKAKTHLLIVIGAATLVYGVLSANYFGITPASEFLRKLAPLWDEDPEVVRMLLIKLSFVIGCTHLMLAHLRKAIAYLPDMRAAAEIGWCLFLLSMLGVIWLLFFGSTGLAPMGLIYAGLIVGAVLAVLFSAPSRNPFKRVAVGFASSLLGWLGTFSDTMSYIRLMAVGMASYYIAAAFNQLAGDVAGAATWFAGAPIAVFGHALNIGLAIIAIFAHGVRLNMLEFSNNAGVQWGGYAYNPFAKGKIKES